MVPVSVSSTWGSLTPALNQPSEPVFFGCRLAAAGSQIIAYGGYWVVDSWTWGLYLPEEIWPLYELTLTLLCPWGFFVPLCVDVLFILQPAEESPGCSQSQFANPLLEHLKFIILVSSVSVFCLFLSLIKLSFKFPAELCVWVLRCFLTE